MSAETPTPREEAERIAQEVMREHGISPEWRSVNRTPEQLFRLLAEAAELGALRRPGLEAAR